VPQLAGRAIAPDPRPAIALRIELERHRERGLTFRDAWPRARRIALDGLSEGEAASWSSVFRALKPMWRRAYERQSMPSIPFVPEVELRERGMAVVVA
jgi:hypothetical protein